VSGVGETFNIGAPEAKAVNITSHGWPKGLDACWFGWCIGFGASSGVCSFALIGWAVFQLIDAVA
jgi:hypothetical protein